MGRSVKFYLGPPGTGKTERLRRVVEEALARGIPLSRIAFVSYSRQALIEGLDRMGLSRDEAPWFRTIHSLAYHLLDLRQEVIMTHQRLVAFATPWGEEQRIHAAAATASPLVRRGPLDIVLQLLQQSVAREVSLETEWRAWGGMGMDLWAVQHWAQLYTDYKRRHGWYDFDDMIVSAQGTLPIDLLIIDEAQDTSPASWSLLRRVTPKDAMVVFAGDDDQAIYSWAGAEAGNLLKWRAERELLPRSHRVPWNVKRIADYVTNSIGHRIPKQWDARPEPGEIHVVEDSWSIALNAPGSWLLLGRSRMEAWRLAKAARREGRAYSLGGKWSTDTPEARAALAYESLRQQGERVTAVEQRGLAKFLPGLAPRSKGDRPCTWEMCFTDPRWSGLREKPWFEVLAMDAEERVYLRALRRRGDPVRGPGAVRVSTIHQAKGAEADHVVLSAKLPRPSWKALFETNRAVADGERRVWYVGVTRARKSLTIIKGGGRTFMF